MNIAGLQKMTLLDYPGKVACTVFLQGCNFRCPFCHNSDLLSGKGPEGMSDGELLAFLQKRQGLLDGVCITGGEPTLQPELESLIARIKALGFAVKLDTNGSRPEVLKSLVEKKLLDYVAMDIKNCPNDDPETAGIKPELFEAVEQSARFLLAGNVDYEFRTTVVDELHSREQIQAIGAWIKSFNSDHKAKRFFLQCYMERESVLSPGFTPPSKEKMTDFVSILQPFAQVVQVRGMD